MHPSLVVVQRSTFGAATMLCAATLLGGCGGAENKKATQIAAKVNREEVSLHQINYRLKRQTGLKPEQMEAAARQILERLIDEELAVQKAAEMKIDRDPKVVQAIEAARRDIIARTYQEKTSEAASRPSAEDIRKYHDDNPALFKQRRIYTLQELAIEIEPARLDELKSRLAAAKTLAEFIDYLKASSIRFVGSQAVRPAEQLPLASLPALAKLKDGEALLMPGYNGAQVVAVMASREAPIDEAKARPVIEQFLWNENKRRMVQLDMKALRAAAKVEYVGKYAEAAHAGQAAASAPSETKE